jgi:hypothetical protein
MEVSLMATELEILSVLKILGDVYPSYKLTGAAIEMYVQLLADIQARVLEQSALDHISRSSFFPSIAELRLAAFRLLELARPLPSEYDAWADVQAEIKRVGYRGQPHFTNPITSKVVKQLGWGYLCHSDNQVSDRAHFIQAYQVLAERVHTAESRLPSISEFIAKLESTDYPMLDSGEQE